MSDLHSADVAAGQVRGDMLFPPSWQGLRQQIVYLAQFGNSIQVIHAESGGGKTSFYHHLLATGLGSVTVGVRVAEGAGLIVFFRDVLQDLGLRPDGGATLGELVASLRGYVQTLHKERSRAVLLVDDAHYLTDSELGALVSTLQGQADAGVGLHVVLFAEPGLAARIDALQVLDVAVHDAPLPLFSAVEVQQLLTVQRADIGAEQAQRIWYQTRGLPGAVMEFVANSLPPPPAAEKVMSMRGLPIGHIAAVVILFGVLIWAFLVRQTDGPLPKEAPPVSVAPPSPPIVPAQPVPVSPHAPASDFSPPLNGAVNETPTDVVSSRGDSEAPSDSKVDKTVEVRDAGVNLDSELVDAAPEANAGGAVASTSPAETAVLNAQQRSSNATSAAVPPARDKQSFADIGAEKLLALPPNAYVLQLMAASAEDKLVDYVAEQPNKSHLHVYKTARDGKVLYILVEGFYADRASAQAAIANLPPGQRKGGPWPKRIELIHQEIRKSR